ncbi:MAG: hypothetical protein K0S01_2877 [Herbinix sp.]|nr:hypothetical protein [Herbinix sp.]
MNDNKTDTKSLAELKEFIIEDVMKYTQSKELKVDLAMLFLEFREYLTDQSVTPNEEA